MDVLAGSTDVTTYFSLRLAATGLEATGLTITDIDLQYVRSGAAPAAKVDATALAATDSAHGDNKAIEIDATDQPGLYRVDWPDAAFAVGVREVILTVKVANVFTEHLRVNLTPVPADVSKVNNSSTAASTLAAAYAAFETGTAQGGAASSITLRAGASASNDFYNDQAIFILSGTGAGQTNRITDYVGGTQVATVGTAWITQPDNTSVYVVLGRIG